MEPGCRKLVLGAVGMAGFAVAFGVWLSPVFGGKSGLEWADDLFNRLSKHSAYFIPELQAASSQHDQASFDVTITLKDPQDAARLAELFNGGGAHAVVSGNQARLQGSLGAAGRAALADAEAVFQGADGDGLLKSGMSGKEVLHKWWLAFGEIYKQCIREGRISASNFASAVRTKACEPAYNFSGIKPVPVSGTLKEVVFLLLFYVLYTVWYGFALMYLIEGLGIRPHRGKKEET